MTRAVTARRRAPGAVALGFAASLASGRAVAWGLAVLTVGAPGIVRAVGPYVRPGVTPPAKGAAAAAPAAPGAGSLGTSPAAASSAAPAESPAAPALATTSLTLTGTRAFNMARAADDAAADAQADGEHTFAAIRALASDDRAPKGLEPIVEAATASRDVLAGHRRQAQVSAGEALQTLSQAARLTAQASPDPIRRDALEQQALLTAHEAAVMAARARAEAERLRALLAEGRAVAAGVVPARSGSPSSAGPGPAAAATGPSPAVAALAAEGVEVPNLVGARLEAASRDLAAAGLRLGSTTGPRDGFVVKQTPDAGAKVAARSSVSLILSGTAATTTVIEPK